MKSKKKNWEGGVGKIQKQNSDWAGEGDRGQGRCERRSENLKKNTFFQGGGVGLG